MGPQDGRGYIFRDPSFLQTRYGSLPLLSDALSASAATIYPNEKTNQIGKTFSFQFPYHMKMKPLRLKLRQLPRPWLLPRLRSGTLRAFSSDSDGYSNQSRGGLPRFFSQVLPASKGSLVHIQGDEFWHMAKVLRLNVNDRIELFNGKGGLVEGCVQRIGRTGLDVIALGEPYVLHPHYTQWHVFAAFGTLKGGRSDWLIEKCTELGANSVTPLLTERSRSISDNRIERLQRVILAATKQCQRLHEMTMNPATDVCSILPTVAKSRLSFVAVAEANAVMTALASSEKECSGSLIIGPEGDFTEKEMKMLTEAGAGAVGLGPHRLRVETATMALLSTLMLWSDSSQGSSGI